MQVSRVISRDDNRVEVEQKGQARLLFAGFPIDVRLAVTEYPYERIVSRAIAGNFREMAEPFKPLVGAADRQRLSHGHRLDGKSGWLFSNKDGRRLGVPCCIAIVAATR